MSEKKPAETKKILAVVMVLFFLLLGLILLRRQKNIELEKTLKNNGVAKQQVIPSPTPTPLPGVYQLKISKENLKVNENFSLDVFFSAPDKKISGTDLRLKFDPSFLQAETELSFGDFFTSFPRKEVDNEKGMIKVTGFQAKVKESLTAEPVKLLTVNFIAVKAGETNIEIVFEKDKTNLSTLVEQGTGKNLLGTANNVTLKIEE